MPSQCSIQVMQAGHINIRFTTLAHAMKALGLKSWDDFFPHWDNVEATAPQKTTTKATKKARKKRLQ